MDRKKLLSMGAEKALKEIISKNGGDTSKDVFENLEYLTKKVMTYGEEFYYIPVLVKKLLCTYIDPDYRIEYNVTKGGDWCEVEARLYWSDSEKPAGIGFVRRYLFQVAIDVPSKEEKMSQLEANCRGASATRAIADAGVASQYWGDMSSFEINGEQEEAEKSAKLQTESKIPEPKTEAERKAEKKEKKAKSKTENISPELPSENEVTETTSNNFTSEEMVFAEDCSTPSFFDFIEEDTPDCNTEEVASEEISPEIAKNIISDMGTYKGQTLGNIYTMMPRNLVYLATHSTSVGKYARAIIATDDILTKMLKEAEEV